MDKTFIINIPHFLTIKWNQKKRQTHISFKGGVVANYSFSLSGLYTKDEIEKGILALNIAGQLGKMPEMLQGVLERNVEPVRETSAFESFERGISFD
jgi:hypothetical protein